MHNSDETLANETHSKTDKMADEEKLVKGSKYVPEPQKSWSSYALDISDDDTEIKDSESALQNATTESETDKPPEVIDKEIEMVQSQEQLLEAVKVSEKEQEKETTIRPCDSCEFTDPHVVRDTTCCWGMCLVPFKKKSVRREFWLISAPGGDRPQVTLEKLNSATVPRGLSANYKFHVPKFRTGNINQLMELIEQLPKLDSRAEQLIHKLTEFMYAILEEAEHISEYFEVNHVDIPTYITRFAWNGAKYPVKNPLSVIFDIIMDLVNNLDVQLKRRIKDYNDLDKNLETIKRQQTSNLLTKSLHGIVKKEDVIMDSEYLTTLLVVVPKSQLKEWSSSYETLSDMVVPQSAFVLQSDENHTLFSVAVYKKFVPDFIRNATENKFTVRNFEFSEKDMDEDENMRKKLHNLKRAQIAIMYRWVKVNFSDCFSAWIHVKALRVFVESALRYGLPVDFQAMLLIPLKSVSKLRDVLDVLFNNNDCDLSSGSLEDVPGSLTSYGVSQYFSYVFLPINIDIFSVNKHNKTFVF